jgi:hypothetical protein
LLEFSLWNSIVYQADLQKLFVNMFDVDSIPELGYFQDFQCKKKGADNIRPITVIWTIYY